MASIRVTMADIARSLGVDPSTVSLALRNSPRITKALRRQIHAAAEKMGYRRDPFLGALNYYRHHHGSAPSVTAEIAWINRWVPSGHLLQYQEFNRYWQGASEQAKGYGFNLEWFNVAQDSLKSLERILRARRIRGVLIPPHPHFLEWDMAWENYSVVRFGYTISKLHTHVVAPDQWESGLLAYRNIRRQGYRRIGFVSSERAENVSNFCGGFLLGQFRDGVTAKGMVLILRQQSEKEDLKDLSSWLQKNKPDAIFTPMAEIQDYLSKLKHPMGENLGIAATSILDTPSTAGIDQNSIEIGRIAVDMVVSLIQSNQLGLQVNHRVVTIPPLWVDGPSLPRKAP
jgi:LacI family transcriptional regulator